MPEPLSDHNGHPVFCMHDGCWRRAVRVVSYEVPSHRQFQGQTHDCCAVHSRATKEGTTEPPMVDRMYCNQDDCESYVVNHYWGKVKASDWFFGRDGSAWCPQHLPDWVPGWRARQKEKR